MAKKIRKKKTFGTVKIDHFSPPFPPNSQRAVNTTLSFEEALKLHLGLGQALGKLNSYNRATSEGKKSGVNLCIYVNENRLTINQGKIR